jgi:hypothetical protein
METIGIYQMGRLFLEKNKTDKYFNSFILGFLFICSFSLAGSAQIDERCNYNYDKKIKKRVYTFVDIWPTYPGGEVELVGFFFKNFKYPEQDELQTFFLMEFVVDIDGKIIVARIKDKKKKNYTKADKEALKVLMMMPNWIPGKCGGKGVPVLTIFPLRIEPR